MNHSLLDEHALASPLRHKNNRLKLGLVGAALLVGVSSPSPVAPLFIALSMSFAAIRLGKVPARFYAGLVAAPLGFAALGAAIIFFFFGSGPEIFSLELFGLRIGASADGAEMAVLVVSRTLSGMSCLLFLALSTPMVELFALLKALRLPDSFVELSMMIYRYIFVLLEVVVRMRDAQAMRLGYDGFKNSIQSISMMAGTLFIRTMEQGERLFTAMDARCYDGRLFLFEERRPVKVQELLVASGYVAFISALAYFSRGTAIF
ncbi:cobalt ECF transporter T component CbiQ [Candidatus Methanocrinis natronophilus]|uniref:Cobalt ECF transporter T component CbiQ n=1 Tax=Candidatus Methanocrinis natronophilus TaxID=3033396 RepID=A0ABT5XAR7_9EURY|nr:cobalt ECF transporter T component CbiQ [Candidatus Methanocrinis natronophilus]MDF0591811.1 cobalt ECF transporter T component CbiQ [Candidatus Methanocrinis natronophilus]